MLKYFRDPIWQFFGFVATVVLGLAAIALANPTLVQRWWQSVLIGATTLVGLVAVLRFWRFIFRGFGWVRQQMKRFYLWILWHLVVRPAKSHLDLMIRPGTGKVRTEELTDLRDRLSNLTPDALQVLEVVLNEYDPMSNGDVLIRPSTIPLSPAANYSSDTETRALLACDKLTIRGFGRKGELWEGKGGLKLRFGLDPSLRAGLLLKMRELVVDELISRNIAPYHYRLLPVEVTDLWRYSFYDNFVDAQQLRHQGSDIDLHPKAICEGETMRAIFEHPPGDPGECTTLTYPTTPPSDLSLIELSGYVGIETHRPVPDGLQTTGRDPDNHVQFEITIDDQVRFKRRKETSQWEKFSILFVARGDNLSICLSTNSLGNNVYNWAVWGEPELIELLRLG